MDPPCFMKSKDLAGLFRRMQQKKVFRFLRLWYTEAVIGESYALWGAQTLQFFILLLLWGRNQSKILLTKTAGCFMIGKEEHLF